MGSQTTSRGEVIDFEGVHRQLVEPALRALMIPGVTAQVIENGNLREDILYSLLVADLVICDISIDNANVFYELGVRQALRKKGTILIRGMITGEIPFDLLTDRYVRYDINNPGSSTHDLLATIRATVSSDRAASSPIFHLMPDLPEVDPSNIQLLPSDFREEVDRAWVARATGWLRLLAQELQELRFERYFQQEGLRLIAGYQWELRDYEGARESWERVRSYSPQDTRSNLALARIHAQLSRMAGDRSALHASDQAIQRVLSDPSVTQSERAELLALRASIKQKFWTLEWEDSTDVATRRERALTTTLRTAYEDYYNAYLEDLNSWYPGLAALQLAAILRNLSADAGWEDMFDSEEHASMYRGALEENFSRLAHLVSATLEIALARTPHDHPDRLWVELGSADLQFLTSERSSRICRAYTSAMRHHTWLAAAARSQLELFAKLSINSQLAQDVMSAIEEQFGPQHSVGRSRPLHVLVFASSWPHEPTSSSVPNVPWSSTNDVSSLIETALAEMLDDEHEFIGFANARPGSELLFHELSARRGVRTKVCLPMPAAVFARKAFEGLDSWRSRFLSLAADHENIELNDREGLPRWLAGTGVDPSDRYCRWLLSMALAAGGDRVTLLALWDEEREGDDLGGVAHFIDTARNAGTIEVRIINPSVLAGGAM
jgi:hypothetical protein